MLTKTKYDRLILISSPDISRGVYESHVISPIEAIKNDYDLKISLISFGKQNLSLKEDEVFRDRLHKLKSLIGEDNLLILRNRSIFKINQQKKIIQLFIENYKNERVIIFCQNYYTGFIGCLIKKKLKNIHLHVDFKGVVPEEHLLYGESNHIKNIIEYLGSKIFEKCIFKYADSFSVVSNKFKEYFESKYHLNNRPLLVLPSSIDTTKYYYNEEIRTKFREILGYNENEIVITYCGSLQKWQQPDMIFNFFKQVSKFKNYKFLVLTFDIDKAEKLRDIFDIPNENIKILSVAPLNINKYLNASDVCILLRKDDIINNVASPTKFGEYLVTKNKIIISNGVGDFSEIIEKSNYGICLDSEIFDTNHIIKTLEQVHKPTDQEINEFKRLYSVKENIKQWGNIFE